MSNSLKFFPSRIQSAGSGSIHAQYVTPVLFTLSILLSASLLFFIQPLLTRMVTPLIGGAPGVWTTAALFFQVMMIGGYLYAHLITRLPRIRHQIGLHLIIWLAASSMLPLQVQSGWQPDLTLPLQSQTFHLYAITIGLPFFFLSSNAPLIQTWYSRTRGPSANDPYFLYGASNVGSLVALLGFPLIAEPFLGIKSISMGWSVAFILLGALLFVSVLWSTRDHPDAKTVLPIINRKSDLRTLFRWGFIAFIPSSLMLALTTRITTDFGSFPLLWVVPLAIYLLTYVAGFQARPLLADRIMVWLYPSAIAAMAVFGMTGLLGLINIWSAGIMILSFAVIGLHLHRSLYLQRPDPSRLTVFYLTLSIGGALGGFFNAIIAPGLMDGMHEFPLSILAAISVLLLTTSDNDENDAVSARLGSVICLILLSGVAFKPEVFTALGASGLTVSAILIACMFMIFPPLMRIGVSIMTAVTMSVIISSNDGMTVHIERNFFGLHRVIDSGSMRVYLNGTTIHGAVDKGRPGPPEPLYYYRKGGPLADIATSDFWKASDNIGLVGLGVGSMLAYRQPSQNIDLYEIDPAVVEIALNDDLFGFVSHYGQNAEIHIGYARILLEEQKNNEFGVLLIDAYSSDSIPMHLATIEAVEIFREDLTPDGILAFHISNRYFDLRVPIGAAAAHLGLDAYFREDPPEDLNKFGYNSRISAILIVSPEADHHFLMEDGTMWKKIQIDPSLAWSDDKASPIMSLK